VDGDGVLVARYYPVSPLFWSDKKVIKWDERTRYLSLYLLTSEHRNLEGLFRLPLAYIQADLDWSSDEVSDHMSDLTSDGFVNYDGGAKVVFLPKALKYHQPKAPKQIAGAINVLQQVPPTVLWPDFMAAAKAYAPEFHAALVPLSQGDSVELEEAA
jgi:hypothetical protein